jgi:uncharacterized lipoprotein
MQPADDSRKRNNPFEILTHPLWGITLLFLIGGCAPAAIPLNYSPSSVLTGSGATGVSTFSYLPAVKGKVEPNQIRNTAMGDLKFDQNIDVYFKDAVFKELRFVGIKVDAKDRMLTGEITEFLIDDLGYSVDWTLNVRYLVKKGEGGAVLYDSEKVTKRNTAKFANPFGALNETIKLNIDEMIKDNAFIKAIN